MNSSAKALRKSIETLIRSGVKLSANSVTICNACYYLHRFCRHFDYSAYDTDLMSAAALYLSAKVNESHLKLKDLILVFYEAIHKSELKDEKIYSLLKDSVVDCETLLLRMLRFKVDTHLPHRYLNVYLYSITNWMRNEEMAARLEASSWSLLNDYVCLDSRCLDYRPNWIAISVIELSLRCLDYKIPYNDEALLPWNEAFDESLSKDQIQVICDQIISLYDESPERKHSDRK